MADRYSSKSKTSIGRFSRRFTCACLGLGVAAGLCTFPSLEAPALQLLPFVQQAYAKIYAPINSFFKDLVVVSDSVELYGDPRNPKKISSPEIIKGMHLKAEGVHGNYIYVRLDGLVGWVKKSDVKVVETVDRKYNLKEATSLRATEFDDGAHVKDLAQGSVFYAEAVDGDQVYGYADREYGWVSSDKLEDNETFEQSKSAQEAKKAEEEKRSAEEAAQQRQKELDEQLAAQNKSVTQILTTPPLLYVVIAGLTLLLIGLITAVLKVLRR